LFQKATGTISLYIPDDEAAGVSKVLIYINPIGAREYNAPSHKYLIIE
jgi:hypothetical protein